MKKVQAIGLINKPKIGNVPQEICKIELTPSPLKPTEVQVKVVTSTIHIDDIAIAQGTALGRFLGPKEVSAEKPYIMGSNFSGIIETTGSEVKKFKIGDEVIGIPSKTGNSGCWATYKNIDQKHLRLKPQELSHEEAVSLILAGCVAYGMLFYSKVKPGDKCLVIGASGGIGSVVVQMLKAKGAEVTGLCSTRNIASVLENGADDVIDYVKENFSEALKRKGKKMDLIFDSVGGLEIEQQATEVLNRRGKFLTVCGPVKYIGSKKLSWGAVINMFWHILSRSISTRVVGPRYIFSEKVPAKVIDEMFDFVLKHSIKVPIEKVIPLEIERLKEALTHISTHKARGRIIIKCTND